MTLPSATPTPHVSPRDRDPRHDEGNVVVLRGTITTLPNLRELSSGSVVEATLVTHTLVGGLVVREPVPLVWDPEVSSVALLDRVIVRGRVRQRFFRSGGVTASRTEVVVTEIVPVTRRKTVRISVSRAAAELDRLAGG